MAQYAIYCQIVITFLQFGASFGWFMAHDWKQGMFWFGLFICNLAYVLMVTK